MLQSPTGSSWQRTSPIEILISRACDPSIHEPNYATHVEVAEYINTKKANNPREAAMHIAHLANHRNPHISILALALLNTLTTSCGYPFHLQIATKEFLNELVRRFPERPPPFPGPVMSRILDTIQGWKEGICVTSRWKEDLGNIRDMHRLLTFKGYRFKENRANGRDQQAIIASANLKSAAELETEDRDAQSAKLQELIRRGTPRDLAAAQELMKSLAGADPTVAPDYRGQAMSELHKLESKVVLLNEMLDNADMTGRERAVSGDVYEQVANVLEAARTKVQGYIGEGGEDSEELDTFLQINDGINTVLARYDAFKRGDYEAAKNPIPKELSPSNAPISLIDFDLDGPSSAGPGPSNDLDDLFGGISLGTSPAPTPPQGYVPQQPPSYFPTQSIPPFAGIPQQQQRTSGPALQPQRAVTPQQAQHQRIVSGGSHSQSASPKPNYFDLVASGAPIKTINTLPPSSGTALGIGMGSSSMGSNMARQTPSMYSQQQSPPMQRIQPQPMQQQSIMQMQSQQAPTAPPAQAQAAKDPFADLAGLF